MKYLSLAAVALTLACGSSVTGPPEDVEYAPQLGVDLSMMERTVNGVYYRDLTLGTGDTVTVNSNIDVEYSGWLVDGTLFDGRRTCFSLGSLIPGWQEGIPGMLVGGKRKLVIPPHMAYGDRGSGDNIPGNATIVFDIEIHAVGCS